MTIHPAKFDLISSKISHLAGNTTDRARINQVLQALDHRYDLSKKINNEPGTGEIIEQLVGRLVNAYGDLSLVKGQRILDIACGSNTSKAPQFVFVNTPFGEKKIKIPAREGYTAQFEPWFCRIILELDGSPVGVDIGDLEGETFEHYYADLGLEGALNFLPDHSFDAVQDSRLFGSPEFTDLFPEQAERLKVAKEIYFQEGRLLTKEGIVIYSDAGYLVGSNP